MMTEPHLLTIAEMARRYDVSLRTLRFYEAKGLLTPIRRKTERLYGEKDCVRLEIVLKGRKLGFTLADIFHLIADHTSPCTTIGDCLDIQAIDARLQELDDERQRIIVAIAELEALRGRKLAARPTGLHRLEPV